MIDGQGETGIKNIRQFAKEMFEKYEDSDDQNPLELNRIVNIYKGIFN